MRGSVNVPYYKHDAQGHMPLKSGETQPELVARHAQVLWDSKMTRNRPPMVIRTNQGAGGGPSPPVMYPTPIISDTNPRDIDKGVGTFSLNVVGTGFVNGSKVYFSSQEQVTTFNSSGSLTAPAVAKFSSSGGVDVAVIQPDGQMSNTKRFIFR